MCPQIACLRRGIVTLITFVFSTVCLFKGHNRIQRHIVGCIGLNFLQCVFSNMSQCISQMIPQILFPRESPKIAFYSGISNDTSKRFSMRERSPTVATSAATQPSKLIIWKCTWWFTVERSLLQGSYGRHYTLFYINVFRITLFRHYSENWKFDINVLSIWENHLSNTHICDFACTFLI